MSRNYTLKYRTFDQLLADVSSDFKKYQLQDLIDAQDVIKVAKRVSYDLGLRINMTKESILEVEKGRVKLPNDFYVLNFVMACGKYETKQYLPQGTHIEEKIVGKVTPEYQEAPPEVIDLCDVPLVPPPCDPCVQLVQVLKSETRTYKVTAPIRIVQNEEVLADDCPNVYWRSELTGYIKDGWLYTSFDTGKVYLNYQGALEDAECNLLVVDHDMINEYYEYALKDRILENLFMNDEEVNPNKIQIIKQGLRVARNNALSIVNTPNFSELKDLYQANRKAFSSKYYDMFKSYSPRY
jgi:hypothetical protein